MKQKKAILSLYKRKRLPLAILLPAAVLTISMTLCREWYYWEMWFPYKRGEDILRNYVCEPFSGKLFQFDPEKIEEIELVVIGKGSVSLDQERVRGLVELLNSFRYYTWATNPADVHRYHESFPLNPCLGWLHIYSTGWREHNYAWCREVIDFGRNYMQARFEVERGQGISANAQIQYFCDPSFIERLASYVPAAWSN